MPENTTYFIFIGAAVVALVVIATLVSYVATLTRGVATKREIEELRAELRAERLRIDAIMDQQFDLLRELTEKTNQWQLGIERMIGRIEGKVAPK